MYELVTCVAAGVGDGDGGGGGGGGYRMVQQASSPLHSCKCD